VGGFRLFDDCGIKGYVSMSKRRPRRRSNLFYYIKEGVSSIFTHGFMSFASVVIIIACLVIMGSFLLVAMNVNDLFEEVENRNQVIAFVDDSLTESDARALEVHILATENVEDATFISNEEAWADFTAAHDERYWHGLDHTTLRHRYMIALEDIAYMESTIILLEQIAGLEDVEADEELASTFIMIRNIITGVFIAIVGVLLVISVFIISNTIKLATFDRREEIAIMRMVGATNWFIRWPFIFQGFILGVTGAAVAFVLQWALYGILADQIMSIAGGDPIPIMSFASIADLMIVIFLGTGFVVGTLGSAIAIRNYLKV